MQTTYHKKENTHIREASSWGSQDKKSEQQVYLTCATKIKTVVKYKY